MVSYIMLVNFTDQDARSINETLQRADDARALAKSFDVTLKGMQWTPGIYDMVTRWEAKDDEAMAAFSSAICSDGNVHLRTIKAFPKNVMHGVFRNNAAPAPSARRSFREESDGRKHG
jgi:uncharacterized protein with GYD domain